ncbi:type II toxin-antitoxin system VapC family toxin [Anabaena cylindrica FACHB-243]|uniref:PilT protein domain protein n=1 Tax=Anabaena cylindrica (strain ATCC 27899 / PCC 7122) TaxID=272123 RepID=K9ZCE1_ANACC|nr:MULTISPECIES: type II toxin-antitoxin system VapC family toxin [Anabaena]AFZ56841.1 PilT protein domain protein [Anabaena cylindrica PCC 7122]MBD2420145.1 type II toxin-antitoxin system VapC family toxin [Anabaena cylindrica FACHB-243]MBY5285594.1 type II toxin-antitoxin system VapC family toxin [Anabaena sp. CCAP 1446/1C]MBY5311356.1 type II toxin-antitoxin system VapC family toxin [Anabaena sp. CCAP 1446/1C]MCM2410168.1 type II toxin-antitoxin system VapC family toxin [Anabaena sp. CCAP 1
MNKSVLDASAFLAYLRDEPGAEIVENALINGCYISIINWVEVLSKIVDLGESPDEIIKRLRDEGLLENSLEIIACNEEDAIIIAKFRPLTKSAGLSLGDRACLALGKRLNLPVLTADKVWCSLSLGITINLIR